MANDKWWGDEEKSDSKKEVQEMLNHTEMMEIKREEEMAQAQHELNMSKVNQEMLGTKEGDPTPAMPTVQANKGSLDWMTDDPGYLFLTILVTIGFFGLIMGSILTPSFEETWGTTDGLVIEGTEWWEQEIETVHEDCLYDEYYDEYYDCIYTYTYTYDCGADVDYNYSIGGVKYFAEDEKFLGTWDEYCLEIVENETLPLNSSVTVWYKLADESTSTLNEPSDTQGILTGVAFCCFLPIILGLIFFMYFEGNNDQYQEIGGEGGDVQIHHHHHGGGGIFGGVYYGTSWHRRPWFHRRRSRRVTSRITGTRRSGGSRRSSGGSRRSSGGSRRSGGGSRRSGGGRRSR
jgi:hypothetical protein